MSDFVSDILGSSVFVQDFGDFVDVGVCWLRIYPLSFIAQMISARVCVHIPISRIQIWKWFCGLRIQSQPSIKPSSKSNTKSSSHTNGRFVDGC